MCGGAPCFSRYASAATICPPRSMRCFVSSRLLCINHTMTAAACAALGICQIVDLAQCCAFSASGDMMVYVGVCRKTCYTVPKD